MPEENPQILRSEILQLESNKIAFQPLIFSQQKSREKISLQEKPLQNRFTNDSSKYTLANGK